MNTVLPTYEEFVSLELKTLDFLYNHASRYTCFGPMSGHILQFKSLNVANKVLFDTFWDITYKKRDCRVFMGMVISKEEDSIKNASYYICIAEGTHEPSKILRKYHFDYCSAYEKEMRQLHPYYHLQYSGKLSPALKNWKVTDNLLSQLEPQIEEPRIYFAPVSLATVMNLVFHEYPSDDTLKLSRQGEWRSIIRKNEELILYPYFKRCLQLVKDNSSVFFDHAYIKPN